MSEKLTPAQVLAKSLSADSDSEGEKITLTCALKALREELSLTQADVARAVGSNAATIGNAERGSAIRLPLALKLSEFFGKQVHEIWRLPDVTAK